MLSKSKTIHTPRWIENAVAEIVRTKFAPSLLAAELEAILVKHAPKHRELERENAKLRNQLAETKSELESIQRRVAHVCACLE